ncbi:hypothetical protein [Micromonospora sp. NPDC093243]
MLNTTSVVGGTSRDELTDVKAGRSWLAAHGQPATEDE